MFIFVHFFGDVVVGLDMALDTCSSRRRGRITNMLPKQHIHRQSIISRIATVEDITHCRLTRKSRGGATSPTGTDKRLLSQPKARKSLPLRHLLSVCLSCELCGAARGLADNTGGLDHDEFSPTAEAVDSSYGVGRYSTSTTTSTTTAADLRALFGTLYKTSEGAAEEVLQQVVDIENSLLPPASERRRNNAAAERYRLPSSQVSDVPFRSLVQRWRKTTAGKKWLETGEPPEFYRSVCDEAAMQEMGETFRHLHRAERTVRPASVSPSSSRPAGAVKNGEADGRGEDPEHQGEQAKAAPVPYPRRGPFVNLGIETEAEITHDRNAQHASTNRAAAEVDTFHVTTTPEKEHCHLYAWLTGMSRHHDTRQLPTSFSSQHLKYRHALLYQQTEYCNTQLSDHITCLAHEAGDISAFAGYAQYSSRNWRGGERWFSVHYPNALWLRPKMQFDMCCGLGAALEGDHGVAVDTYGLYAHEEARKRWSHEDARARLEDENSTSRPVQLRQNENQDGDLRWHFEPEPVGAKEARERRAASRFRQAAVPPHCRISGLGRQTCVHNGMCLSRENRMLMYHDGAEGAGDGGEKGYFGELLLAPFRSTATWGTRAHPRTVYSLEQAIGFDFPRGFTWEDTWKTKIEYGWRLLDRRSKSKNKRTMKTLVFSSALLDGAADRTKINATSSSAHKKLFAGARVVTNIWHVLEILYGVFQMSAVAPFESLVFADPFGTWARQTSGNQDILQMVFSSLIGTETRRLVKIFHDGGRAVYYRSKNTQMKMLKGAGFLYDAFFHEVFFEVFLWGDFVAKAKRHPELVITTRSRGGGTGALIEDAGTSKAKKDSVRVISLRKQQVAGQEHDTIVIAIPPITWDDWSEDQDHDEQQVHGIQPTETTETLALPGAKIGEDQLEELHSCFDGAVHFAGTGSVAASTPADAVMWRRMLQGFFPKTKQGRFHVLFSLRETKEQYAQRTGDQGDARVSAGPGRRERTRATATQPKATLTSAEARRVRFGREIVNQEALLKRVRAFLSDYDSFLELKVHYGHEPFEQQVALFAGARLLVHVFGQASALMAFMPADSTAVLLYPHKTILETFYGTTNTAVFRNVHVERYPIELVREEKYCDRAHGGRALYKVMMPHVHSDVYSVANVSAGLAAVRAGPHYEYVMRHCGYELELESFMRLFANALKGSAVAAGFRAAERELNLAEAKYGKVVEVEVDAEGEGAANAAAGAVSTIISNSSPRPRRAQRSKFSWFLSHGRKLKDDDVGREDDQDVAPKDAPRPREQLVLRPTCERGDWDVAYCKLLLGSSTVAGPAKDNDFSLHHVVQISQNGLAVLEASSFPGADSLVPPLQLGGPSETTLVFSTSVKNKKHDEAPTPWHEKLRIWYEAFYARMRFSVRRWDRVVLVEEGDGGAAGTGSWHRDIVELGLGQRLDEITTLVKITVGKNNNASTAAPADTRTKNSKPLAIALYEGSSSAAVADAGDPNANTIEQPRILLPIFARLFIGEIGHAGAVAEMRELAKMVADVDLDVVSSEEGGEEISSVVVKTKVAKRSDGKPWEERVRLWFKNPSTPPEWSGSPASEGSCSELCRIAQSVLLYGHGNEKQMLVFAGASLPLPFPASGMRDAHYWRLNLARLYPGTQFRRYQVVLNLEAASPASSQSSSTQLSATARQDVRHVVSSHLQTLHGRDSNAFFVAGAKPEPVDLVHAAAPELGGTPSTPPTAVPTTVRDRLKIFSQCSLYVTVLSAEAVVNAAFMPEYAIAFVIYPGDDPVLNRSVWFSFLYAYHLEVFRFKHMTAPAGEVDVPSVDVPSLDVPSLTHDFRLAYSQACSYVLLNDYQWKFFGKQAQEMAKVIEEFRSASSSTSTANANSSSLLQAANPVRRRTRTLGEEDWDSYYRDQLGKLFYVGYNSLYGAEEALKTLVGNTRTYVWEREVMRRLDLEQLALDFTERLEN